MPYRRLPTTDKARTRALEAALEKVAFKNGKVAISERAIEELQTVKSKFENTLKHYEMNIQVQSEKYHEYKTAMERARMYVSHFIQVLYLTSERGEINGGIKFYGLEEFEGKVPPLNTEEEILYWGSKVVEGEQKRIQKGGSAIYNPSIALVRIKVEEFKDAAVFQQNLKKNTTRTYNIMQGLRKSTNDFISQLWTEIEEGINTDNPKHKRQIAQDYGIVYIFRRKEKRKLTDKELQRDLLFDFA
ncbi:MAG: hypothetical protein FD181_22 [Prolixibacteraceae bacterium]|nr:MAG: hypothetical protein FD181_22 [Prolixibacteraceae bacterium]